MKSVVIVGAGGLGRSFVNTIRDIDRAYPGRESFRIAGVVDDSPSEENLRRLEQLEVPYLGTTDEALDTRAADGFLLGINEGSVRERLARPFVDAGYEPFCLIHPSVYVPQECQMGEGTVLGIGVRVDSNVELGRYCSFYINTVLGHDAQIHDYVSTNSAALLSGAVVVGERALIGAGAVVLLGLTVGRDSVVGAQACVTRDVAEGEVVAGVPARPIR